MTKVFLIKIDSYSQTEKINQASARLLAELGVEFSGELPIKVHFGEKGNKTFIEPQNFKGIIDYLKKGGAKPFFTDTNALYKGERTFAKTHLKLAREHGFTDLPVKIADGDHGESVLKIVINKNHFKKCKVGKIIGQADQMLVLAHFKGHMLSGFGGAIKQLGMGGAARGGKLDMHSGSKPIINPLKCQKCATCVANCPNDAIILDPIPKVVRGKCLGCAICIAVCPNNAAKINWLSATPKKFMEKLAEYAYATQKNKKMAHMNFIFNVTKNCDCYGVLMKPVAKDIGILASVDPVALDKACLDLVRKNQGKKVFSGDYIFDYAEEIGLGKKEYELVEI